MALRPGERVVVAGGSGLDSGKHGTVRPFSERPALMPGTGEYKAADPRRESLVLLDDGSYIHMFNDRLDREPAARARPATWAGTSQSKKDFAHWVWINLDTEYRIHMLREFGLPADYALAENPGNLREVAPGLSARIAEWGPAHGYTAGDSRFRLHQRGLRTERRRRAQRLDDQLQDIFWRSIESEEGNAEEEQRVLDDMLQDAREIAVRYGFEEDDVISALRKLGAAERRVIQRAYVPRPGDNRPGEGNLTPEQGAHYGLLDSSPEYELAYWQLSGVFASDKAAEEEQDRMSHDQDDVNAVRTPGGMVALYVPMRTGRKLGPGKARQPGSDRGPLGYGVVDVSAYDREKGGRTEDVRAHQRRQIVRRDEPPSMQPLRRRRRE